MDKFTACLSLCLMFAQSGWCIAGQGVPAPQPAENRILDAAIAAHGWKKLSRPCPGITWKYAGELTAPGGKIQLQNEWTQADFNEFQTMLQLQNEGRPAAVSRCVVQGREGWRQGADGPRQPLTAAQTQPDHHVDAVLHWIAFGKGLEQIRNNGNFGVQALTERIEVDNKPALGLQVRRRDFPVLRLYFDAETSLLVKAIALQGESTSMQMTLRRHHFRQGLHVPTEVIVDCAGRGSAQMRLEEWRILPAKPTFEVK